MPLFFKDSNEPQPFTLKCDPGHGTDEPCSSFLIKPLTKDMMDQATTAAGPIPWRGRQLITQVQQVVREAVKASLTASKPELAGVAYLEALKAIEGDSDAMEALGLASILAESKAMGEFTAEDRQSVADARTWVGHQLLETVRLVMVEVDGEPVADLETLMSYLRPASLRDSVLSEVREVAVEMAQLDPKASTHFVDQYGSDMTPSDEGGTAKSASTPAP